MKYRQLLPLSATAGLFNTANADNYNFWCGKKYNATSPSFAGYGMAYPLSLYDLPHGAEYHAVRITQGTLPYQTTDTDSDTSLVAYVPESVFAAHGEMNVTVSVPQLDASVTIAPHQAVSGVAFGADAAGLSAGKNRISAAVSYARFENGTAYADFFDTVFFDFWVVDPPPQGQSVVALDALNQSMSVDGGAPFYPIGYYVDNSYMFSGDYAAAEAAVQEYAAEGYNVLMHAAPIGSNATQMQWTLELCDKYGLYYQCDVTDMTANLTALGLVVSDFASQYGSFLSYYIGNEPDGSVGLGSLEPVQSLTAHEFLKLSDPYHPVTLVTNCAHTMPIFEGHADFVMTDIYSVGIPTEYFGIQCNATQGCCGCDLCDGSNPVRSIFDRYDRVRADLGVEYPAMWFVEQTFYDNTSYWSRPPSYQEELAMAWASVVSGGAGVLGYTWPVTGVPITYPQLGLALADFASQMSNYSQQTVLSGPRVAYGSIGSVYYAAWSTGTVVALNINYNDTAGFAAAATELGLPASATIVGQSLGRNSNNQTTTVSALGKLFVDELLPLEIKVYTVEG